MTGVARTPSASPPVASDRTLHQIEFPEALALVAEYAVSAPGRERILARRPRPDADAVRDDLADVRELLDLVGAGEVIEVAAVPDLRDALDQAAVEGSVLDPEDLIAVGRALEDMVRVMDAMERVADHLPRLTRHLGSKPPADVVRRFARSFDPDGSISDAASPDVRRGRRSVREARTRLVGELEKTLRATGGDGSVTIRNGRYVIPVRKDSRAAHGIVHGESNTGQTVFVEPSDAVGLGNALQGAESELKRAELAVLRDLTGLVRDHHETIRAGFELCVRVDDVHARMRYAKAVGAGVPAIDPETPMTLRQARHPVLLGSGIEVVPFDLSLDAEVRVVLISGPNTGGKTVLLKSVGLMASLVQSGVIPPVGPGSSLPVFGRIVSDIGDHQSIRDSLSTFGAHVVAAREALDVADARTLVLMDEVGTGTDPAEGAALAGALIETLAERSGLTVATTHLGQVKEIASGTGRIVNASLEFDADGLEPTYRFRLGMPGRSFGLAIARRLGLPEDLLARADALRPEAERSFEALLADVERREEQLRAAEERVRTSEDQARAERDGLDRLRRELQEQQRAVEEARRDLETQGRQEARAYLLEARKRVEEALARARADVSEATAREARKLVEEGVRKEGDALERLQAEARKQGWTIRVGRGAARRPAPQPSGDETTVRRVKRRASASRSAAVAPETEASTEVDLRGMTGDEAEPALLRAMDAAVVEGLTSLRIIHGKGTGALRERVRHMLKADRRVKDFRTAPDYEGGWGVTIAEFTG